MHDTGYIRKYKRELELEIVRLKKVIITHWTGHKKPNWTSVQEESVKDRNKQNRYDLELLIALAWITTGAKSCSCFNNSLYLQNIASEYFLNTGELRACTNILRHMNCSQKEEDSNFELHGPKVKTRKLLLYKDKG